MTENHEKIEVKQGLTTDAAAPCLGVKPQTMRRGYCVDGAYMGIKPLKLPNGRLLWPVEEIKRLLEAR